MKKFRIKMTKPNPNKFSKVELTKTLDVNAKNNVEAYGIASRLSTNGWTFKVEDIIEVIVGEIHE